MDIKDLIEVRLKACGTEYILEPINISTKQEDPLITSLRELRKRSYVLGCSPEKVIISGYINHAVKQSGYLPKIKDVIFSPPATIVLWEDGTKTVVKCQMCGACIGRLDAPMEFHPCYDPEKGLAMCIAKKALGNKGNYYNEFKKWLKENE